MKAKFDDQTVTLTPRFIEVMMSECEMMAEQLDADCWTWGRCYVGDLANTLGLTFEYGGTDDLPDDGLGAFAVVCGSRE